MLFSRDLDEINRAIKFCKILNLDFFLKYSSKTDSFDLVLKTNAITPQKTLKAQEIKKVTYELSLLISQAAQIEK